MSGRTDVLRGLAVAAVFISAAVWLPTAQAQEYPVVSGNIVGGSPAPDAWHNVVAVDTPSGSCTGTLVDAYWVLTAAHCIETGAVIRGGSNYQSRMTWQSSTTEALRHPRYDGLHYDFGLYRLPDAHPFTSSQVRWARPTSTDSSLWASGSSLLAMGWGITYGGSTAAPDALQQVEMKVYSDASCARADPSFSYDASSTMCVYDPGQSTCQGDSGGPLFGIVDQEVVQVGVTSYGRRYCDDASYAAWLPAAAAWMTDVMARTPPPPPTAPPSTGGMTVERLAGADRFQTAAAIAQKWPSSSTVFVGTGATFPDSLAGGAAASRLQAPLLLVSSEAVPTATATELDRLQPSNIVILGGETAVSSAVEQRLATWAATTRLSGADRYATAISLSRYAFASSTSAWIASGQSAADGLIAGAAAAGGAAGQPLLLVDGQRSLERNVVDELRRLGVTQVFVVGDTSRITQQVTDELASIATVTRFPAGDVHERSVSVWSGLSSAGSVLIATSRNFPDGLAGGALTGFTGAPLLLVPGDCVPESVLAEISRLQASRVMLLGGTAALTQAVADMAPCF